MHGRTNCGFCGKNHANEDNGWTVVRNNLHKPRVPYKVYKRDMPADEKHMTADLAPFTHPTQKRAINAGRAGHMAYLPMHHIYISGETSAELAHIVRPIHEALCDALRQSYPHLTFDCDVVEGVSGVRFHTTKYDLDSPLMQELRSFCRAFMQEVSAEVGKGEECAACEIPGGHFPHTHAPSEKVSDESDDFPAPPSISYFYALFGS